MSTEEDRTAGSNYLTGRLVDLARAAHWARLMKDEQPHLDEALDRALKEFDGPQHDQDVAVADAVAQLREEAVSEYMVGVSDDDDPAEASFAMERVNRVIEQLELIATRAGHLRSYAEHARYLVDPPVLASYDPWNPEKSPDGDRPSANPNYRAHLEPKVDGLTVYMPTLGTALERVQVSTITGYHDTGLSLSVSVPDEDLTVGLTWEAAELLIAQMQQLIRFHRSCDSKDGESK